MTSAAAAAVFDNCRARIDELLDSHADMGVVEHAIDAAYALDGEEKDALWLWACGRRDRLVSGAAEPPIIGSTAATEAGDPEDSADYPRGAGHD
jgi:hypothetical protein